MQKKVVFFDSGIGGLSTLATCLSLLPTLNYVYIADNKNAPYGKLTAKQVIKCCLNSLKGYLNSENVGAIVIACNTATACAIQVLRNKTNIPIIGIEPAIESVAKLGINKAILLATPLTISQPKFANLMKTYKNKIILCPQPNLATLIENYYQSKTQNNLNKIINEIKPAFINNPNATLAILGCTHYSLISKLIEETFNVKTIDQNLNVANELAKISKLNNLANPTKSFPQFITTAPTKINYSNVLSSQLKTAN